jgi:hypothetical protein
MKYKQRAIEYLTARWTEQCDKYLTMRNEIPLAKYISVNLPYVIRNMKRKDALTLT